MRLFDEVLPADGAAVVWTDDPKSAEVIERVRKRGIELMTVGRSGEIIQLVEQQPTALGQNLVIRHGEGTYRLALPLIGAYQASNVLVAAGLAHGDRQQLRKRLLGDAAARAGPRAAGARGDQPRRRAGLCRLCAYAGRDRSGDRGASSARQQPADHRVRRGRRPRPGQEAGDGRGRGAAVGRGDRHRRQSARRGSGADPRASARRAPRARWRSAAAARPSPRRSAWPGRATSCCSPARATRQGQIIGAGANQRVLPFDDVTVARECAA